MNQLDKVRKYYDSTVLEYKVLWLRNNSWAMHFGYYDDKAKHHSQAVNRLNEVLVELAKIKKQDRILDAGCGYGASSLWLAKNIGCQTIGLTIVPYQIKKAQEYAKKLGLESRASFELQDYAHTNFPDKSFDVVWGVESIVHAQSKKDFVDESFRLLRPGGRLLISEYILKDEVLSDGEEKIIAPWLKGWEMPSLMSERGYRDLMDNAGFKHVECFDLTENVAPSLRRLDLVCRVTLPITKFVTKIGLTNIHELNNALGSIAQSEALRRGIWRYKVLVATKT